MSATSSLQERDNFSHVNFHGPLSPNEGKRVSNAEGLEIRRMLSSVQVIGTTEVIPKDDSKIIIHLINDQEIEIKAIGESDLQIIDNMGAKYHVRQPGLRSVLDRLSNNIF
ncbi:hypothetical protein [Desulfosporosinus fructosivorans]